MRCRGAGSAGVLAALVVLAVLAVLTLLAVLAVLTVLAVLAVLAVLPVLVCACLATGVCSLSWQALELALWQCSCQWCDAGCWPH